jgi:hypothetical protein
MSQQPRWVWTLWRAAITTGMKGRNIHAERCHVGLRPINYVLRRKLAYVRGGWLYANKAGRAELKRRGLRP